MEDYRLEQQKNTAAQILLRAPLLNLYAYKQSLPPAIARFRLLQVISQSAEEADPTLASAVEQASVGPLPGAQPAGANLAPPEPQPAQQHAAAEPQQGPQPPRPAPDAIDEDPEIPRLASSSSDSDSASDSLSLSDLEEEALEEDAPADFRQQLRGARAAAAAWRLERVQQARQVAAQPAQPEEEQEEERQARQQRLLQYQQQEGDQQQQLERRQLVAEAVQLVLARVREFGQRQAAVAERQARLEGAEPDDEVLPDAE